MLTKLDNIGTSITVTNSKQKHVFLVQAFLIKFCTNALYHAFIIKWLLLRLYVDHVTATTLNEFKYTFVVYAWRHCHNG